MPTFPQSFPMNGGDGPHSYIHNSSYQKVAIDGVKERTSEAILEKLDLEFLNRNSEENILRIVDFGCSIGPNTFDVVQNIIDTVKQKRLKENKTYIGAPLEFQVCFNDQPNNDFNTLFRTQPFFSRKEYFSVGVPGSFHGRVLPKNSLHIGHTSYTLHWLSNVPQHVCDKKSPALNKSYIQCNNLVDEVTKAYKIQFRKDFGGFLEARAEELVSGGLMILSGQCLPDGIPKALTWQGVVIDMIGDCLMDLAKLGITSKEKIELFSLPTYIPHISEFKANIEQNENFNVETMEEISHPMDYMPLTNDFITSMFRAILNTIIEEHFGEGVVNELFSRLAKRLDKYPIDFKRCKKYVNYFIVLKRK
ncbi:S-adenosyl-L-methionine:salicylic acid carboxyl methyltransferase-like protein [Arabidopsis thaliana]|uniref:Probable S-adenosylmethionine-dependent methyltransferase At5g37970 n=1 Tax=Arabidopsis thaliana TaxID=3702 RepID=MT797_ARATH|nr:S-adenosyl-L-methionine-dependent methyltransferase superfamily protein [Arabidopsis thaliana]Q9FKD0.1 RecName: Full=Probable S-adenosylmethionine-dependent methyltransferase At5g37970 [Arabidopsis thaliana]AED94253.2 S-adenosyl-L-methionine-dependent methyltransferase superfamily protein [Arabidopsis thaliana]BAB09042.1 S-adenosyl-L-methionine:salicylic acid carboxyl methyltransferase-like protein [Arabidopsis thaliana]|eukprot:NP_198613.2 S-adenosyl-L-methionine-dependent methyltransferase superfamily protein [Arabidopsis thaliana]